MDYHACREDALRARTDILQCAATIVIPYYYILSSFYRPAGGSLYQNSKAECGIIINFAL